MKILMLSTEYPPEIQGGLGTYVAELASGLGYRGCEVTVLTLALREAAPTHRHNVSVYRVLPNASNYNARQYSFEHFVLNFNQDLVAYARSLLSVDRRPPDLVHCNDWFLFNAAAALSEEFGIPLVSTIHLLREPLLRWWGEPPDEIATQQERALCERAHAIITVSESMRSIIATTHHMRTDRIHVVYNGMDFQPFAQARLAPDKATILRQHIAAPSEKIVLFAGRIGQQKGIDALFAAAHLVAQEYPQVRYVLVGDPHSREQSAMLQHLQTQYPLLHGRVKVFNKVSREQLFHFYQIADIVQIPSIYEPFGYVAIEAMAMGIPVIATRVGGLAEIIHHEETGLLVPIHTSENEPHKVDVECLAAAQVRLLTDPQLARGLGVAGQSFVVQTFTQERMVNDTQRVYRYVTTL